MLNMSNDTMKRLIQRSVNEIIDGREYSGIKKIDVFFVFGSKTKTAFCDWVYGIKVFGKSESQDNFLISKVQRLVQSKMDKILSTKVCCTDVIYQKI